MAKKVLESTEGRGELLSAEGLLKKKRVFQTRLSHFSRYNLILIVCAGRDWTYDGDLSSSSFLVGVLSCDSYGTVFPSIYCFFLVIIFLISIII